MADDEEVADLPADYVSPFRFFTANGQLNCLVCTSSTFTCSSSLEMRKHMVDSHDDAECERWGFSRDLLYQEFVKQGEDAAEQGEVDPLGKRQLPPLDDNECDFRKRICLGI
jgi:hypothetical protein